MAHQFDLIPEGRAERVLLQVIGFEKPNHADGIGDTLNKIENRGNHFALGIVDNDKRKPALFDRYQILLKEQQALQLLQKPHSLHFLLYFILLSKNGWLIVPMNVGSTFRILAFPIQKN